MTSSNYRTIGMQPGRVRSANGVPEVGTRAADRAGGLCLSCAVLATYVQVDGEAALGEAAQRVAAVYCDVMVCSTRPNLAGVILKRVPVSGMGLHNGHIWKPRASTKDVVNGEIDPQNVDPRNLDGDHVLVQFLEDSINLPVITGRLPHPRAGLGNDELTEAGHRSRLKLADGSPDLWKQNGTFYGIDAAGNFVINTARAHGGEYDEDGAESPENDSSHGKVDIIVNKNSSLKVRGLPTDLDEDGLTFFIEVVDGLISIGLDDAQTRVLVENKKITLRLSDNGTDGKVTLESDPKKLTVELGGASLTVEGSGSTGKLTLGNGAVSVAVADVLQTLYTLLKTQYDVDRTALRTMLDVFKTDFGAIGSATGAGASSATAIDTYKAATPLSPIPDWDAAIKSDKAKIPSN